jgi:hypothetical protein
VKRGSKPSTRQPQPAAQAQQPPLQPVAAQPAAAEGEVVVVVKRKRGRPPKPRPLIPIPTRPLLYGKLTCCLTLIDIGTAECSKLVFKLVMLCAAMGL